MKVLICGGRTFAALERWPDGQLKRTGTGYEQYCWGYQYLNDVADKRFPRTEASEDDNYLYDVTIISGAAKGADSLGEDWAVVNWTGLERYPADWKTYNRKAGSIRNQQMLDEGKPDLVIAFPGGSGTAHMKRIARAAGVEVIEVIYGESFSSV